MLSMTPLILAALATAASSPVQAPEPVPPAATPAPPAAPAKPVAVTPFVAAEARQVVEALAKTLEANFVFPEVGQKYAAALRTKLDAGGYASFSSGREFAAAVTTDLQAVAKDGHLKLVPPDMIPQRRGGLPPAGASGSAIAKSGWLAPGVAYISFVGFPGDEVTTKGVAAFLADYRSATTLIVDARDNRGGGLAEMDLMFAQLFDKPTELVRMDTRLAVQQEHGSPFDGSPTVTRADSPMGVARQVHRAIPAAAGAAMAKTKVYLLTSARTASAGEHFSLSLKRTHRATLIGETTRGAGHYGGFEQLPGGYAAFIPVGRTFDPDTGEGWEGKGVRPDVEVPADKALDEALRRAGVPATGTVALVGL
jgi:hypothetical protein